MGKKAFFETDEFQKLQTEWYARLEREGFEDVERGDKNGIIQPQIVVKHKRRYNGSDEYHELCQAILRDYRFKRAVDRLIFELHTEGRSVREIEHILISKGGRRLKKTAIDDVIRRVKENFLRGND